jgi:hypothetical protein
MLISRAGAIEFWPFSSPTSSILIEPSGFSVTAPASACFAARTARTMSAWVKRAGRRLILSIDLTRTCIDRANDRLAAVVDMHVFNANVLFATTAQAPESFDLGTRRPQQFGRRRARWPPPKALILQIAPICVRAIWMSSAVSISSD